MVYITGDTHGDFDRIFQFCDEYETTLDDILIILGDAGINYFCNSKDNVLKEELSQLPITLFCIHGNHEERPSECGFYDEVSWHGGITYIEDNFPNIIFAKDGEIYDFNGLKAIAIGGAYSVDKYYRLANGLHWFDTEQPDDLIKHYVESKLNEVNWKVDIVLSHTVPVEFEPTWAFIPGVDQSTIDKSTEKWLQQIYDRLDFSYWYAGHYHVECQEENVRIMYEDIDELPEDLND